METTTKTTIIDRLKEYNPAVEKFIEIGDHDEYSANYDMYDKNKIEVIFDNNLTSNCLSIIFDTDNDEGGYFLLHFDDNTGAYYREYECNEEGANLLLDTYQRILREVCNECFSVHDFIDTLTDMKFTYSRY